jgi:hypothetical protein
MTDADPKSQYDALYYVYDHLNARLFEGMLPGCLITMQRQRNTYGFFARTRFESYEGDETIDEIALNPTYVNRHRLRDNLSTLAHEMVHQWQQRFGKPSRNGYHNREWAEQMLRIGLVPSDTGQAGGKQTGQRLSHYIADGGPFDRISIDLLKSGFVIPYVEQPNEDRMPEVGALRRLKAASKTRYSCPHCSPPLHVWGKPGLHVVCGTCCARLEPDTRDEDWGTLSPWREPPR